MAIKNSKEACFGAVQIQNYAVCIFLHGHASCQLMPLQLTCDHVCVAWPWAAEAVQQQDEHAKLQRAWTGFITISVRQPCIAQAP